MNVCWTLWHQIHSLAGLIYDRWPDVELQFLLPNPVHLELAYIWEECTAGLVLYSPEDPLVRCWATGPPLLSLPSLPLPSGIACVWWRAVTAAGTCGSGPSRLQTHHVVTVVLPSAAVASCVCWEGTPSWRYYLFPAVTEEQSFTQWTASPAVSECIELQLNLPQVMDPEKLMGLAGRISKHLTTSFVLC